MKQKSQRNWSIGSHSGTIAMATLVAIGLWCPIGVAHAESTGGGERIHALEAENSAIRTELEEQRALIEKLVAAMEEPKQSAATNQANSTEATPSVSSDGGLFSIKGRVPIEISGFIKGDMQWSDSRLNSTSAPRFVRSEVDGHRNDDQFSGTVQHSRVRAKIGDIALGENAAARGFIEMDYFNLRDTGDTNFNNNQLRVRQLYSELSLGSWDVLIGQSWDLFSPLNVGTLNTNGNYWFGGNAGFRRPQLRVTNTMALAEGHKLKLAGSVNANVGVTVTDAGRTLNSGRDAGTPVMQGQIEYSFPGLVKTAKVGVSGFWGEEDLDGVRKNVDQWAFGAHVVLPLTDWLSAKGEYQHGKNTDAFLTGGGINAAGFGIDSDSGWVQLTANATDELSFSGILGFEDIDNDDLTTVGRASNRVIGVNAKYKLFERFTLGIEYTHFDTNYVGAPDETANMMWVSGILNF